MTWDRLVQGTDLLVELVDAVAWPVLIVAILVVFRGEIRSFLNRVVHETEEVNVLGVTAKFREVRGEILKILDRGPEAAVEARDEVVRKLEDLALEQFEDLSKTFYSGSLPVRNRAAEEVADLALDIPFDALLSYAASEAPGERAAAGIGLRVHLESDPGLASDPRLHDVVSRGLRDGRSRVRYRYAELAASGSPLARDHAARLEAMARSDGNSYVREKARQALRGR